MKKIIIGILTLSVCAFSFGGGGSSKYNYPNKSGKVIKVAYDTSNSNACKRYLYLHTNLKATHYKSGGKHSSESWSQGRGTMWATSGSATKDCGIKTKVTSMSMGQMRHHKGGRGAYHLPPVRGINVSKKSSGFDDRWANNNGSYKGYLIEFDFGLNTGKHYFIRLWV